MGRSTGSLKHLNEMGQKKVAGAPASAARTSRSLLSGPSCQIPADGNTAEEAAESDHHLTVGTGAVPGTSLAALAASGTTAPIWAIHSSACLCLPRAMTSRSLHSMAPPSVQVAYRTQYVFASCDSLMLMTSSLTLYISRGNCWFWPRGIIGSLLSRRVK